MAINWDLQAVEVLEKLGCTGSGGQKYLEEFQQENGVKLPETLYTFLCAAWRSPLLRTADIWTYSAENRPMMYFLYEEVDEMIESDHEYWEEDPQEYEDNDYYKMWKLPREDWGTVVPNYLEIGSDAGAGVVVFGIRADELSKTDPPVYMQHEADPITLWNPISDSVSEYVMQVLCDVLVCSEYHTAKGVLEKTGWKFREFHRSLRGLPECGTPEEGTAFLQERGIDISNVRKHRSLYGVDAYICCGWEEDTQTLYIIKEDLGAPEQNALAVYTKA